MPADYAHFTDAELAELINEQDRSAFQEVYSRYWPILYIHAKKMMGDGDEAQDIIQDLFTNLFRKMGQQKLNSQIGGFLYRSTRNLIIDAMRSKKRRADYLQYLITYKDETASGSDADLIASELTKQIEKEIGLLSPRMRQIFEMSRRSYKTNKEIATELDTTEKNVQKQIQNAVKQLKSKLTCFLCLQIMSAIIWLNRFL